MFCRLTEHIPNGVTVKKNVCLTKTLQNSIFYSKKIQNLSVLDVVVGVVVKNIFIPHPHPHPYLTISAR
jgi:hypothetical protein